MDYPKRKHTRLKNYDYSQNGSYHIIIHASKEMSAFSDIVQKQDDFSNSPIVCLRQSGKILEKILFDTVDRFDGYEISAYCIMPTHIHILLLIQNAAFPITEFVKAFKSLGTRECNITDKIPGRKVFQTSFYEHIIRNDNDFSQTVKYISENAIKEFLRTNNDM